MRTSKICDVYQSSSRTLRTSWLQANKLPRRLHSCCDCFAKQTSSLVSSRTNKAEAFELIILFINIKNFSMILICRNFNYQYSCSNKKVRVFIKIVFLIIKFEKFAFLNYYIFVLNFLLKDNNLYKKFL